jgi:hypothetical protein
MPTKRGSSPPRRLCNKLRHAAVVRSRMHANKLSRGTTPVTFLLVTLTSLEMQGMRPEDL